MPRRDYVEVAEVLDADVIDAEFMLHDASPAGRLLARQAGILPGVLYEAYAHRRRYQHILAWADRAGLPLALLYKMTGVHGDLSLLSVYLSQGKKAVLMRDLRVHTHLRSVMYHSSVQKELAAEKLGVPQQRQHYVGKSVDDRFWSPMPVPVGDRVVSAGWEARDYPTLLMATDGLSVDVDIAVGTLGLWSSVAEQQGVTGSEDVERQELDRLAFFENFRGTLSYPLYRRFLDAVADASSRIHVHHQLSAPALREMYARARVIVVPLHDVEFDAGVTSVTEAMAMGKPVIATRTKGQVDVLVDGEHGFYVPPGDARALRAAIEHVVSHPAEAERMGRAGREYVVRRHALDDYVARVVSIVRDGPQDASA